MHYHPKPVLLMRFIVSCLLIFFMIITCQAQQANYTAFTVNDGLPSNFIYGCIEDDKGFLWIATDAGIARFDGKRFQVFTIRQGLPDNEVLAVVKEKNGRIWVSCFKQSPAYFDEVKNRFINAKEDSNLAKVSGTGIMYVYALQNGGVMYYNEKGSFIFRDKKLIEYNTERKDINFLIKENDDGSQLRFGSVIYNTTLKTYQSGIFHIQGGRCVDSIVIRSNSFSDHLGPGIDDGKFYVFNGVKKKCFIYSNIGIHPIRFKLDSINIPEPFFIFSLTGSYINLYSYSGKIYVFDKNTLQRQFIISGKYAPNSLYNDSKGNIWVSTIDKGLILYKKRQFDNITMPGDFSNTNFLSIARKQDGTLLAGNYYGEVLETNGNAFTIHSSPQKSRAIFRQRKILLSQNKIFTFSEAGVFVNFTKQITTPIANLFYAKTAINYNDSTIITGVIGGLQKLNTRTGKVTLLFQAFKRVTALAKANDGAIYFGSTDGLYKYDYVNNSKVAFKQSDPLLNENVVALCTTADNLLWMATSGNGIVALKDDKVLLHITEKEGIINNSSRSITAAIPGQVWLGTAGGISVINYKLQDNEVSYTMQHLSVNDGLTSNVINEMLYRNDTVYAATANGISVIPAGISIPVFNIPVQIINVSINQRDTIITNKYDLGYHQQNILIRFAGIELSGHFKNLQYTLDNNRNWITLDENTLNLQLNNGRHTLQVRAVDVNENISDKILTVQFNIATPFWKAAWFWLVIAIGIQLLTIYLISLWQKKRKETKLAKEIAGVQTASLEQQAFTSLMNPHFMFNALNSIQHYINLQDRQSANRYLTDFASLIRKNFEAAQQSFIPLEQELENIRIYLRLEQMRFTNRFSYRITVDESLDIDHWVIPTMMLQPLLENALLHGIMPSVIMGELIIDLKEKDENLLIAISDNGIGITNSRALKENSGHKSRGMELIKKRIAALNHFVKRPITLTMTPAFDNAKNPGNKITLFIPVELHKAWLQAQRKQN